MARLLIGTVRSIAPAITVDKLGEQLKTMVGLNPFEAAEVDDAGFDLTRGVALFSDGASVTLLAPIRDNKRLASFLTTQTKTMTGEVTAHRDLTATSYKRPDGTWVLAQVEHYLVMHFRPSWVVEEGRTTGAGKARPTHGRFRWLDEIVDLRGGSTRGAAANQDLQERFQDVRKQDEVLLYLDARSAGAEALRLAQAVDRGTSCKAFSALVRQLEPVSLAMSLTERQVGLRTQLRLAPALRDALVKRVGAMPVLPASIWDRAPARLAWRLDPAVLPSEAELAASYRCGVSALMVVPIFSGLLRWARSELVRQSAGHLALAILAADERGESTLHLKGALVARASNETFKSYWLGRMAGPVKSKETVSSRTVFLVQQSRKTTEHLRLTALEGGVAASMGDGVIEQVLAFKQPVGSGTRVAEFQLVPGGLTDLRAVFRLLEPPLPENPLQRRRQAARFGGLDSIAGWLSAFERIKLRADLRQAWGVDVALELNLR
jgi:hypothetical protein